MTGRGDICAILTIALSAMCVVGTSLAADRTRPTEAAGEDQPTLSTPGTTRESFDAGACWQDSGGKIIIRLMSGKAFAFEPTNFTVRVSWDPVTGPDLPPEGCPGNPLVVRQISFPHWDDWPVSEAAVDRPTNRLERLMVAGHEGPIHAQRGDLRRFVIRRNQTTGVHCEVLPGQLEVCRACTPVEGAAEPCRNRWAGVEGSTQPKTVGYDRVPASYRALPGAYFEHDGLPFAPWCTWPVLEDTPRWCQASYGLEDGISVHYKINDWKVPETEFIAFDRKLRAKILSARAPEFDATPEEMERFQ